MRDPFLPQLSIILPTLRPIQAQTCLESLYPAVGNLDAEIIVICDQVTEDKLFPTVPADVKLPVIFSQREQHDGPIAAIQQGYEQSAGDYVFVLGDEDRMTPSSLQVQYEIAEKSREAGEQVIFCPWEHGSPWAYWERVFPPFPFVHRSIIEGPLKGVFFDTAYRAHYSDPDLGQRAAEAGIPIRLCNEARIYHGQDNDGLHQKNSNLHFAHDELVFRYRWGRNPDGTLKPWPSLSM